MATRRLKIVADDKVPFLEGVLEPYADVVYKGGAQISPADVADADALIVRTRTQCAAPLLEGSSVKLVSTATIGMDHIDRDYCASRGIAVANAAGCNAGGVMQYVFTALFKVMRDKCLNYKDMTLGIVGVGHVGSRVLEAARAMGIRTLLCDPPRALAEGGDAFVSLEYLLEHSDVVTMHVPLLDTTRGMCDEAFFAAMKPGSVFINAARGEVLVDEALIAVHGKLAGVVIDTWNGESSGINPKLLAITDIATPHIAGYSYQGKLNGTSMAVRNVARHFGIGELVDFYPEADPQKAVVPVCCGGVMPEVEMMAGKLLQVYDICRDDAALRLEPAKFEYIRTHYDYRAEVEFK